MLPPPVLPTSAPSHLPVTTFSNCPSNPVEIDAFFSLFCFRYVGQDDLLVPIGPPIGRKQDAGWMFAVRPSNRPYPPLHGRAPPRPIPAPGLPVTSNLSECPPHCLTAVTGELGLIHPICSTPTPVHKETSETLTCIYFFFLSRRTLSPRNDFKRMPVFRTLCC